MPFDPRVPPEPHGTIADPAAATGQPYPLGVLESLVRLAARSCNTEFSALYFTDRRLRWLSISLGLDEVCPPGSIDACLRTLSCDGPPPGRDAESHLASGDVAAGGIELCVRSWAGVRLREGKTTLGTLYVLDRRPAAVAAECIEILRELAGLAGSIVNTWLVGGSVAPALGTREQHCLRMFDGLTDLVFTQDLNGALTGVNESWETVLGFRRDELLGKEIAELVAPHQAEAARQMVLELPGGSGPRPAEMQFRAKDGRSVTLELRSHLLFEYGQPIGLLGFARKNGARSGGGEARRVGEALRELHRLSTTTYRDSGEFFEDTVRTCCEMLGVGVGMLAEFQDEHCLIWASSSHPDAPLAGQRVAIPGTRFAALRNRGRTCRYSVRQPRRQRAIYEPRGAGFLLCSPVYLGERLWGVLAFASREHMAGMDEQAVRLAELAARSLGQRLMEQTVASAGARARRGRRSAGDARKDRLTGLLNSHALKQRLEHTMESAERNHGKMAAILIDLDRFKHYNDALGHAVADRLLRRVGERLRGCLRPTDVLGRLEADRFLCIMRNMEDQAEANRLVRKMQTAVRRPFGLEGLDLHVTASFGVSVYPKDAEDPASLVWNAEAALDEVKKASRDDVAFFAPRRRPRRLQTRTMESALRGALERGEFQLRYHPQFRMDGTVAAMEVLLSWRHKRLGDVPAEQFIPVAEDTGLIVPIGAWVLRRACLRNAAWRRRGLDIVKLAVNVSSLQLAQADFVDVVAGALNEAALPGSMLELEVTESVLMRDIAQSAKVLAGLRKLGVGIAIDDFGTGYSSLSYLRRLPASTLKIDRSFLEDTCSAKSTLALIETIVSLAHGLEMSVVGEGVERPDQLELLQHAGCDRVQGHLFGLPLSVEEAGSLIQLAAGNMPVPQFPRGSRLRASRAASPHST